jgi:hypothetical protein
LSFDDKLKDGYHSFDILNTVSYIEDKLWLRNATKIHHSASSLRGPTFVLISNHGIVHGESLIKCELSDMFDFIKPDEGPDGQYGHILIMQIHQGKTLQHKTIWGLVMRNRDVKMCPLGSTALYLYHRFGVTQEEFDFSENSNWFRCKLILSLDTRSSLDKEILVSFYWTMLQKTCGELYDTTDKGNHFGWKHGALYAEMQDIPILKMEHLGNWSTSQRGEDYSTGLSMKALRVMGVHDETKSTSFLPVAPLNLLKNCKTKSSPPLM